MLMAKCSARKTRLFFIVTHCEGKTTSANNARIAGLGGRTQMRESTAKILWMAVISGARVSGKGIRTR